MYNFPEKGDERFSSQRVQRGFEQPPYTGAADGLAAPPSYDQIYARQDAGASGTYANNLYASSQTNSYATPDMQRTQTGQLQAHSYVGQYSSNPQGPPQGSYAGSPYTAPTPYRQPSPAGSYTASSGQSYTSEKDLYSPPSEGMRNASSTSYGEPSSRDYSPSPGYGSSQTIRGPTSYLRSMGGQGSSSSGGLLGKLKDFAPGQSVDALINPPPPSFQRAPAANLPYPPFEPTSLIGTSNELSNGFPALPPPIMGGPHPFPTHDVHEEDWTRFLHDVKAAASLSGTDRIVSNVAPMAAGLSFGVGLLLTRGIEKHQKGKKSGVVGELIDYWNHHFFNPRRINVVLARGASSYSGPDVPPPDMAYYYNNGSQSRYDSDSDSDSDGGRHRARRERKHRDRELRRERRKARKELKRDAKRHERDQWRLVVAYRGDGAYRDFGQNDDCGAVRRSTTVYARGPTARTATLAITSNGEEQGSAYYHAHQ
ncbi:predicted protein [Postia placenta Mad-698-R]|nr:predicted protein [Postia placenta Mad-698-R]